MRHLVYATTLFLLISGSVSGMEMDISPAGQEMQMRPYAHFNLKEPYCDCCGISIWSQQDGMVYQCSNDQCDDHELKQRDNKENNAERLVLAINKNGKFLAADLTATIEHKYGILMGKNRKPIVTFDAQSFDSANYEIHVTKNKHIEVVNPVKTGIIGGTLLSGTTFYSLFPESCFTIGSYVVPIMIASILSFKLGYMDGKTIGFKDGFTAWVQQTKAKKEQENQNSSDDDAKSKRSLRRRRVMQDGYQTD